MNAVGLLLGEPSLHALYERTVDALLELVPSGWSADDDSAFRRTLAGALVEAAEVGGTNPVLTPVPPVVGRIAHTHAPPAGKVGVRVTRSTQGVSVEIDVDRPKAEDETWGYAASDATAIASEAYGHAVGRLLHDHGLSVGKDQRP